MELYQITGPKDHPPTSNKPELQLGMIIDRRDPTLAGKCVQCIRRKIKRDMLTRNHAIY